MGNLPTDRLNGRCPFKVSGVDLCDLIKVSPKLRAKPIVYRSSTARCSTIKRQCHELCRCSPRTSGPRQGICWRGSMRHIEHQAITTNPIDTQSWTSWSREYLLSLRQKQKWTKHQQNLEEGTVVIRQHSVLIVAAWRRY
ncbi:uncharacterized protein LOC111076110 [Drosophila obscura]|uniref:uncharacterized protein LOC111076110 n=1 Tax=Drosophila obscura TaxID=7282 RepID=UPI001BB11E89|nr:uncharacterized protein LOC111076110 [Drosophila obscura]